MQIVDVYYMDQLEEKAKAIAEEKNAAKAEGEEEIQAESLTQEDVIKYILEQHPNLKGICAMNLSATKLVTDVLTEVDRDDLSVVGFDGGNDQMKAVKRRKGEWADCTESVWNGICDCCCSGKRCVGAWQ